MSRHVRGARDVSKAVLGGSAPAARWELPAAPGPFWKGGSPAPQPAGSGTDLCPGQIRCGGGARCASLLRRRWAVPGRRNSMGEDEVRRGTAPAWGARQAGNTTERTGCGRSVRALSAVPRPRRLQREQMRTRSTERCCGLDAGAPTTQGKGDQLSRAAAKGGSSIQVLASSVPPERNTQPHHRVSATPKKTQHPTQNMLPWDKTPLTLPSSEGR
ncbi:uncharacterized protein LOC119871211 isoform X2 [Canis lupus familiaris]|uniref:uncharacterized protein LOC119871211 isoform X2 n=1 Tax=Canis lupus familiaris TaxID=9615 RepID=UPI0018F3191B|nr:uncharacterized protein LOC119871211 isoform X2 [Canis lupus familiaris]XP_038517343.1 uncharacterized protein LOC119871211 isoform X2 [Canis lupus familiaris]